MPSVDNTRGAFVYSRSGGIAAGEHLSLERSVDADQGLFVVLGDRGVAQDLGHEIGAFGALLEQACPLVERLRRDAQAFGDALQDLGRGLAQPPFDLAQIGVRDPGLFGKFAQ
jgi:hypothetical protein